MEVKFLKFSQLLDPKKEEKKELSLCNYALRTTQSCLKPAPISASKQEIMFSVNSAERITGSFFFQMQYKNKVGEREKTLLLYFSLSLSNFLLKKGNEGLSTILKAYN